MTTIATDGRSIAGDGLVCQGDSTIVETREVKVRKVAGAVFGLAGKTPHMDVLAKWLKTNGSEPPKIKGSTALVLRSDGTLLQVDEEGAITIRAPAAIGSGRDHALTAMDMGADPERAVEMAAKRDPFTGGKITALSL